MILASTPSISIGGGLNLAPTIKIARGNKMQEGGYWSFTRAVLCPVHQLIKTRLFDTTAYLCPMPKSISEPCLPSRGTKVPDRPEWLHEHDNADKRCAVHRNGHDWSGRYPGIVEPALRNRN